MSNILRNKLARGSFDTSFETLKMFKHILTVRLKVLIHFQMPENTQRTGRRVHQRKTRTADVVKTTMTNIVITAVAKTIDVKTHPAVNRAGAKDCQPPALQSKLALSTSSENSDTSRTLTKVAQPQVVLLTKGQEAALNCVLQGLF
jgi:hypothetical protein